MICISLSNVHLTQYEWYFFSAFIEHGTGFQFSNEPNVFVALYNKDGGTLRKISKHSDGRCEKLYTEEGLINWPLVTHSRYIVCLISKFLLNSLCMFPGTYSTFGKRPTHA
jgi:hypothetical protein